MHTFALLTSVLVLASVAVAQSASNSSSIACNNSPELCSRSYSAITHLGAHDSPFVRDASTHDSTASNQYYNSTVQLSAGVRLLTAQVHKSNNDWHLCHTSCDLLDAGLLSAWLAEIKTWMDNNPNDVVTLLLINSDNAPPSELSSIFVTSGLATHAYVPPDITTAPTTWPTLQELINANTRLMTFIASLDTSRITSGNNYLMDEFTFIFENPYTVTDINNFTCTPDRPTAVRGNTQAAISSNRMALVNHFLDQNVAFGIDTPDIGNITTTNGPGASTGNLGAAAAACQTAYGKAPTFLLVDFFDQGPAIQTVDTLNGITAVGRTSVPSRDRTSSDYNALDSSFAGVTALVSEVKNGHTPTIGAWIWAGGDWTMGGVNFGSGNVLS